MAGKTLNERMVETEETIQKLKAQTQLLQRQIRARERKQRNHRLIQIGAIMCCLGVDTVEKAQALQKAVEGRPQSQEWLNIVAGGLLTMSKAADKPALKPHRGLPAAHGEGPNQ